MQCNIHVKDPRKKADMKVETHSYYVTFEILNALNTDNICHLKWSIRLTYNLLAVFLIPVVQFSPQFNFAWFQVLRLQSYQLYDTLCFIPLSFPLLSFSFPFFLPFFLLPEEVDMYKERKQS